MEYGSPIASRAPREFHPHFRPALSAASPGVERNRDGVLSSRALRLGRGNHGAAVSEFFVDKGEPNYA